ncbi:urate hydroxylase PuuD [Caulobacter sp.]|uniref:urate hydroxylase PuuD n=1 Tax=Caulobacter sp. TaxID=78 RepID=UPI002B4A98B7|nr:urate hydroxylase PuuD [Caulobacter sp.]HJV40693.1 urate hydroxylase PuuD [Caulobacter sp.]
MSGLLSNFRNTIIVSFVLALVIVIGYSHSPQGHGEVYFQAIFRWLHVMFGILWIGLLYYFNFVQIRVMPQIPAELKPAVSKYIAPEALFWFRWAALATWVMGVILAYSRGYLVEAFTLGLAGGYTPGVDMSFTFIGTGMWLATVMFLNVWVFIWPNQKIALGMVEADADAKAKAAKMAMLFSRTNTLLSIPMLATMAMNQTLFG